MELSSFKKGNVAVNLSKVDKRYEVGVTFNVGQGVDEYVGFYYFDDLEKAISKYQEHVGEFLKDNRLDYPLPF